jgi:hypothetical protein
MTYFEINSWNFTTFNLLFDDPYSMIVELHLEYMLEHVLQNDIG